MKLRITALFLAALLLLTGCVPEPEPTPEPKTELDLGTTSDNIATGTGRFAMANGFVYSAAFGDYYILEYDTETGNARRLDLPEAELKPAAGTSATIPDSPRFMGCLFLLNDRIAFVDRTDEQFQYQDDDGKYQWSVRTLERLAIMDPLTKEYTYVGELGNHVYKVIPIKKTISDTVQAQDNDFAEDNPLAGLELYYYFGYDTYPEMAAQMAQDGIILEEPVDENERNRYLVPSLGVMDGDTRQTKVLVKGDFDGNFFVDEEFIYYFSGSYDAGTRRLHRSRRDQIDFETIDLGSEFGNCIVGYDGGFYFYRLPSKQICYYKDGQITELPIGGIAFKLWRDKIIYLDNVVLNEEGLYPIKMYDKNTGEIETLCKGASFIYFILGDKYLGYFDETVDINKPKLLLDLETGKQVEISAPAD